MDAADIGYAEDIVAQLTKLPNLAHSDQAVVAQISAQLFEYQGLSESQLDELERIWEDNQ